FTLCAPAHELAARAALAAAGAGPAPADGGLALFASTVREHLLRLCHDWPCRHAPGAAPDLPALAAAAPLWAPGGGADRGALLAGWLRQHLAVPADWLRRGTDAERIAAWCEHNPTPAAQALRTMRGRAQALATPAAPGVLTLAALPEIARRLGAEAGYALQPRLDSGVPDTGPWSRAADGAAAPVNAWERLASRLVDLVRLAADPGRLAQGATALDAGTGLAWAETARGLLLHRVRVEDGRIADYRVLAPTEWNFHADGVLARTLQALAPEDGDDAELLAAAFDPCVPVRTLTEAHHA
ncbi:nickel-dependent hydrogenase large subunit, partial [Rubrivivax gelatinosus]